MGKAAEYDAWIINIGEGDQVYLSDLSRGNQINLYSVLSYFKTNMASVESYTTSPFDFNKQFSSGFVDINPNSKIPALLDRRAGANNQRVFESGSILLYLSEAFDGAFLPKVARCKMNGLKPSNTVLF